jgi:cytochrome c-type biogenesis protein CcsB
MEQAAEPKIILSLMFFTMAFAFYFATAVCYILNWFTKKKWIGHTATALAYVSLFAMTMVLISRAGESGHAPFSNLYESMCLFIWALTLGYLVMEYYYKLRIVGAFVMVITFLSVLSASLLPYRFKSVGELNPALQSKWNFLVDFLTPFNLQNYAIGWLDFHVFTTFIGYAAFAIAFGLSIMYLTKERKTFYLWVLCGAGVVCHLLSLPIRIFLKSDTPFAFNTLDAGLLVFWILIAIFGAVTRFIPIGKRVWIALVERFPDSFLLDEVSYRMIAWGFPFLGVGIVSGAVWANYAWGTYWSWDPKETWSLITWLIYAAYLHARFTRGWRGYKAAYISVIGFLAVIFLYWGVSFILPGLHAYA